MTFANGAVSRSGRTASRSVMCQRGTGWRRIGGVASQAGLDADKLLTRRVVRDDETVASWSRVLTQKSLKVLSCVLSLKTQVTCGG